MTSPDLIRELQASRPLASDALRARVRELAAPVPARARRRPRLALPRPAFVLAPAAAALVVVVGIAGVLGATGSGGSPPNLVHLRSSASEAQKATPSSPPLSVHGSAATVPSDLAVGATPGRAQQVDATLTVKVADSDHVSSAAQDAIDLTRSLG